MAGSGGQKQNRPSPKGRPAPCCMTRPPKRARESRAGRCRVSPSPRRQAGVVPQSIPAAPHPGEATTWAAFAERFCRTERDRPPSPPMFNQSRTSALRVSSASWLGRQAVLPRPGGLCLMGEPRTPSRFVFHTVWSIPLSEARSHPISLCVKLSRLARNRQSLRTAGACRPETRFVSRGLRTRVPHLPKNIIYEASRRPCGRADQPLRARTRARR